MFESRYFGKVCDKHPDLNGERRTKSRECLGCQRDRKKRHQESPEAKAARALRDKATRESQQFARQMAKSIESKILNRQIEIQTVRLAYMTPHIAFRQEAIDQLRAEGEI